jgi:hypothetical protein
VGEDERQIYVKNDHPCGQHADLLDKFLLRVLKILALTISASHGERLNCYGYPVENYKAVYISTLLDEHACQVSIANPRLQASQAQKSFAIS